MKQKTNNIKLKYKIIIFIIAFILSGGLINIIKDPVKFLLIWGGIYYAIKIIKYYNNNDYLHSDEKTKGDKK
jgi:hypothetical protein